MCNCARCKAKRQEADTNGGLTAEMSNPGVVGRFVGTVRDARTGERVAVIAKHGEPAGHAMARVAARHR